jgi:hypothetical protein
MPKRGHGKKTGNQPASSSVDDSPISTKLKEPVRVDTGKKPEYILPPGNIIVEQNEEMRRQDEQLVDLEASITNLRDASLTINNEVSLQNRLLDDVHSSVDRVQQRQTGTQDRLQRFMQTSGTCKLWGVIIFLAFVLVLLLALLK